MGLNIQRKISTWCKQNVLLPLASSLLPLFILSSCASVSEPHADTVVYLVRHAEKVVTPGIGPNPDLTDIGKARAQVLVEELADKGIQYVHSSDFTRTKDTAAPIAKALGLEVEIYDAYDMTKVIGRIKILGGKHLVVGHSNTTPEGVLLLGGEEQPIIHEEHEHDRLYKVTISTNGEVETQLSRYENRYIPEEK